MMQYFFENRSVYVAVKAQFSPGGQAHAHLDNMGGRAQVEIDRVTNACRRASMKAGSTRIRYAVEIGTKHTYPCLKEDK